MDFELDDDQQALQDAAREILARECPPSLIRAVADTAGWDRGPGAGAGDGDRGGDDGRDGPVADSPAPDPSDELWRTLVSLDWPGLTIEPEAGGSGATEVELAILLEELGHVVDPTPFLATTTQYVPLVQASTDAEQRRRLLGAVVAGGTGTLALAGPEGRWDPAAPPVRAERTADGWALSGTAQFVLDGDRADEVAVVASTGASAVTSTGASTGASIQEEVVVLVVPRADLALPTVRQQAFDPTLHVCTVDLTGTVVADDRRLALDDPAAAVTTALELAVTGLALSAVGACRRAFDLAVAYSKERHQFDVPIGSFQALKHKAVDMYTLIERARAAGQFAALCIAEDDPRRSLASAMAKAAAGDAQHEVFEQAIQFFGGIGFTWENDLHLYLRRAKACDLLFGGGAHHRASVGRAVLAERLERQGLADATPASTAPPPAEPATPSPVAPVESTPPVEPVAPRS